MRRIMVTLAIALAATAVALPAPAAEIAIEIRLVSEQGVAERIGTITAADSPYGLILTPQLGSLPPGLHGFHVHQHPDCGHALSGGKPGAALAAGGHYDPANTDRHAGPYGNGHLGDLPALYVDAKGSAATPLLAPRLKAADLRGRSLMIHAGADNYSDLPEKLGGGGARIACGAVR
ncbi:MAG: superoxide dismutase [Cu-Zn] SodC [Syntrophales bacterium]